MNLFSCIHTLCRCYKANKRGQYKDSSPTGIIVHSTGANNPNLRRYVQPTKGEDGYDKLIEKLGINRNGNAWNNPTGETCVHAFIGKLKDGSVATAKILPWHYACWGCASGKKGSFNYSPTRHIQFEVCEDGLKDEKYFNTAVKTEAVELCAYLCNLYKLDVSTVVSHKEAAAAGYASNHGDIDHWLAKFGYTMKDFRKWVSAALKKLQDEDEKPEPSHAPEHASFAPYKVKVTASALNYRAGAGTNYKVNGVITDRGVYTIVDEADGKGASKWGKLKSGAGWISLDYVTKR